MLQTGYALVTFRLRFKGFAPDMGWTCAGATPYTYGDDMGMVWRYYGVAPAKVRARLGQGTTEDQARTGQKTGEKPVKKQLL